MTSERIHILDELRGLAVLGMLVVNMVAFGLPRNAYVDASLMGEFNAVDQALFHLSNLAFEGAFRAIFCVLFGLGVMLQYERMSQQHSADIAIDRHRRRMVWLMVVGLIDAYVLLWFGDILLTYGFIGLALLRVRQVAPRRLLLTAGLLLALLALQYLLFGELLADPRHQIHNESEADIATGYFSAWHVRADFALSAQISMLYRGAWEALALMLIGMAAYKWDIHRLAPSRNQCMTTAGVALLAGLSVNALEIERGQLLQRPALMMFSWSYDLGRMAVAVGLAALLLLIGQTDRFKAARHCLRATGRMALTNYLLQSLIGLYLFVWLGLFGALRYHQLMILVCGIWMLQMAVSVLWLRFVPKGPVEWVWEWLIDREWNRAPE